MTPKGDKYFFYFSNIKSFVVDDDDDDMWLEYSGASRNMTRKHGNIYSIMENRLSHRVDLGGNHNYAVK